jgi:hypothetical protein
MTDRKKVIEIPTRFHVSEHIREELEARKWDLDFLAVMMEASTPEFKQKVQITRVALDFLMELQEPNMILGECGPQLDAAFGVSAGFFDRLHEEWRKQQ